MIFGAWIFAHQQMLFSRLIRRLAAICEARGNRRQWAHVDCYEPISGGGISSRNTGPCEPTVRTGFYVKEKILYAV